MKKLFVVYHYFAHYRKPVITSLLNLSSEVEPFFISDYESNQPELMTMDFSNIDNFHKVENKWFGKWLWQKKLLGLLISKKPEHVIFLGQFSFISTWVCSLYLKMTGKKVYFWGHGLYGNEKGVKKIVRCIFNKLPHKHLVYGHHAKLLLIKSGVKESKVIVIYNSLDYHNQKLVLKDLQNSVEIAGDIKKRLFPYSHKSPLAIFIGRLTSVKNLEMVIQSLSILKAKNIVLNFLMVGDGPQSTYLKELVIKLGLEKQVHFFGACHDEKTVGEFIYSSDICISPGNVGLTAMHSLSYGTPVITHNKFELQMPEFEAIKPDVNGDFFEYGDVNSLVSVIEKWLVKVGDDKESIFKNSISVIDELYNPDNQANLILGSLK